MAKVAIVVGKDFEDSEYDVPRQRLVEAGHEVVGVGVRPHEVLLGKRGEVRAEVDVAAGTQSPEDYDALLIPGGYSPDHLRTEPTVVEFVRDFASTGKPVAAICHGPQLLIEADAVKGRRLTSWPSVRKDLENAGARWVDEEVVVDGPLITSRKPDDLEAFSSALLEKLS